MNPRIRVIKHDNQSAKEPELDRLDVTSRQRTREITSSIKLWVSEFKERRRTEDQQSRSTYSLTVKATLLLLMIFLGGSTQGRGQQLRDAFHKVKQSVVIIRTQQKEVAPSPQGGTEQLLPGGCQSSNQNRARSTNPRGRYQCG